MSEAKFNRELRIKPMLSTAVGLIYGREANLPGDWLESERIRIANDSAADGWLPLRFKPADEFFNISDSLATGYYTVRAGLLCFGGPPDSVNGINYELSYYGKVPVFGDDPTTMSASSWLYSSYPDMYLWGALMHSGLHAVGEEQTALNFKQLCEDAIAKENAAWLRAKASGSRLGRARRRSFG